MMRITLIIAMAIVVIITASPIDAQCGILGRARGVLSAVLPRGGGIRERIKSRRQNRQGRRHNRQSSRQSVMDRHAMYDDYAATTIGENDFLAPIPDAPRQQFTMIASRQFSTIPGWAFSTIPTNSVVVTLRSDDSM